MSAKSRFAGALLGYLGAAISAVAYLGYAAYLIRGAADTNVVTWTLWSIEAVLSYCIYKKQTRNDLATYFEELVASVGCCAITVFLVTRAVVTGANLFGPVEWIDGVSALLFLIVFWIYRRSLRLGDVWPATLFFQVALVFSALPLVRSTFENPSGEPFWPWTLWAVGFALQFLCASLRQRDQGYRALLTPLNYFFWHAVIAGIVLNAAR